MLYTRSRMVYQKVECALCVHTRILHKMYARFALVVVVVVVTTLMMVDGWMVGWWLVAWWRGLVCVCKVPV